VPSGGGRYSKCPAASVRAEAQVVDTEPPLNQSSAAVSGVIDSAQIQNLATNGRNWASLLVLAPLAIDDGGGDQRSIRFAGHARDDNNYLIDGVDATGIQEQAQKSTTRLQVSEDAIEEYRVSTALYDAQYGAGNGGQIDIVTKSGTNEFHGSMFEYLRNSAFDSRSFLDLDLDPASPSRCSPISLKSVWRNDRRTNPEKQHVLLHVLPGLPAIPRSNSARLRP
jgi:hypothetical protein